MFALVQRGARVDQHCENVPLGRAPVARCIRVDRRVEPQHQRRAYPTTYTAEIFYPPCFSSSVPPTLSYGGPYFNLTVSSTSYTGTSGNVAAANTTAVLSRGGFSTHAMNMGHRHVQLNNTHSVNDDGSYVLHVSQVPPNANVLTPGPALPFVVVNGVPSNGTMVIVGTGVVETQPTAVAEALPAVTTAATAAATTPQKTSGAARGVGLVMGTVVGAALVLFGSFGTSFFFRFRWVLADARSVNDLFWTFLS